MPRNRLFLNAENLEQFKQKYNISQQDFEESLQNVENLNAIYDAFESKKDTYLNEIKKISSVFENHDSVHSVSSRVKDSEHLIEKVIRKSKKVYENEGDMITDKNYEKYITDLMGLRLLILFKEDWESINDLINKNFKDSFNETPFVYIRTGDDTTLYDKNKIKIIEKGAYRSVHYVIKTSCGGCIEIQVRTLYEEAWSEIDHKIRYPYNLKGKMLNNYINIMNRLSGTLDEMGSFINNNILAFSESAKTKSNQVNDIINLVSKVESDNLREEIIQKLKSLETYRETYNIADIMDNILKELK